MIIDIHGHYTTEPAKLLAFRDKQLAGLADPMRKLATSELGITDEELLKSVEPQLKLHLEGAGRESSPLRRGGERRVPTMGVSVNQGLYPVYAPPTKRATRARAG
jgi:4-oxalmesaconate hydratase